MRERKKLVTSETKINIDEEVFKKEAEELTCKLIVAHVNKQYRMPLLEIISSTNQSTLIYKKIMYKHFKNVV